MVNDYRLIFVIVIGANKKMAEKIYKFSLPFLIPTQLR